MENSGKTAVFPGGYARIGEIQHGRIGVYRDMFDFRNKK